MSGKINWLANHAAPGSLVLQQWLLENDISYSLTNRYLQSGWLKKLFTGVYYRPDASTGSKPDWAEAINALNKQTGLEVHLAGLSSLQQQGLGHYVQMESKTQWLGVKENEALPKWFREFPNQSWVYCRNSKLDLITQKDFSNITVNGKSLLASSPELAAYETVDAIGKQIAFEHVAELFQSLVNLSPRKVQALLSRSRAVRTNRVFLYLGHYYDHAWAKHLDESKIVLGSGKRQVVPDGRYLARYQITVPEEFESNSSDR